jgi:diguanylate cyclase (GGDEF)-like protein
MAWGQPPISADHAPVALRVLAVDDDELALAMIEAVLDPLVQVTTARSGEEALELLGAADFALVLLDVGLPGIDGFETAKRMKQSPTAQHTPIIFLTGEIGDEQVRKGYALGAADYLLKPFDPEILRAKVQVFVDLARLRLEAGVLSHRSLHDELTGLPNRALFLDRLEHALARISREDAQVAVLFLDLDGFKAVNDTLGHEAGDRLLVEVAERLQTSVRVTDTGARFGGDEFLVLLEGIHDVQEVEELVARIRAALAEPCDLDDDQARLSAAVGVAMTDDPAARPESLIRAADEAMLREKLEKRARESADPHVASSGR